LGYYRFPHDPVPQPTSRSQRCPALAGNTVPRFRAEFPAADVALLRFGAVTTDPAARPIILLSDQSMLDSIFNRVHLTSGGRTWKKPI